MNELKAVLTLHSEKYPGMKPQDAVKLIYQNEFGGGHIIKDPESSYLFLVREYEAVEHDDTLPLTEDIGNGMCRLNLGALDPEKLSLRKLNDIFVRSAEIHRGEIESFKRKLDVLREVDFGFTKSELDDYISEYIMSGCPMVSHSENYRKLYSPAYRVVLRSLVP